MQQQQQQQQESSEEVKVVEEEEAGSKKRSSVQNPALACAHAPMRPCWGVRWMDEQTWRLALGGARGDSSRGGFFFVYVRAG